MGPLVFWIIGEFYGTNASPHVMSLFKLSVINGEVPSKINFDYFIEMDFDRLWIYCVA